MFSYVVVCGGIQTGKPLKINTFYFHRKEVRRWLFFVLKKTRDYTVMSNHHLKDRTLTLKSKGLLSMILSLPDEWNYTTRGLAAICREGVDSIGAALKELETHGYIRRTQLRDEKGKDHGYRVCHLRNASVRAAVKPRYAFTGYGKAIYGKPGFCVSPGGGGLFTETPAQLNTNQTKTDLSSTEISNPIPSNPPYPRRDKDGNGSDGSQRMLS